MVIRKIRLENFKKFKHLEKEFSPGINVVKGARNETGKSTLLEGILVSLFENPKSSRKALDSLWTWGTDGKGRLCLEFSADGKNYVLDKDFNSRGLQLIEQDTQMRWNIPSQIEDKLDSLLGTNSRDLFLSTCCIRQDEVRAIQSGKTKVEQSIEQIITGGAQGITAREAVERLDSAISELKRGLTSPAKYPGPVAAIQAEISQRKNELARLKENLAETEKLRSELPEIEKQIAKLAEDISICEKLLNNNRLRQDIENRVAQKNQEYDELEKLISEIESAMKEKQSLESELQGLSSLGDEKNAAAVRESLLRLDERRNSIAADLNERRQELAKIEAHLRGKRALIILASKAVLIGSLTTAVLGALAFFLTVFHMPAAIAVALGIVLVVASLAAKSSITTTEQDKKIWQKRISDMESALADMSREEDRLLSSTGCRSREEFDSKYAQFNSLQQKLKETDTKLNVLLQGRTYEQLRGRLREIARELAVEEQKLTDELKSTKLPPEDVIKYQERKQQLENEKSRLEYRRLVIQVRLQEASDPEVVNKLEEELEGLTQEMSRLQRKLQICELAKAFISKAKEETLLILHDQLETEIAHYLSIFTDGKYNKVRIEKGTLDCTIFSDEKGDWVHPEELSGGTIDQFYLAYRLALAHIIYRDKQPPLILDDPFYNFDSLRLSRALASLKELSKNQQVIIFTLGDTYDSIADRIIELSTEYPR